MADLPPYRVIQWATGSVGREALEAILLHPALELAGVLVHSEEKNGRDAGELCGAPATGVLATSDKDAIVACEADCVVYAPRRASVDDVCALLRSGRNVVCNATIDEHVQAANVATAMQAVSSVPALCEAEPGWRTSAELGLVSTGIGFHGAAGVEGQASAAPEGSDVRVAPRTPGRRRR